MSGDTNVLDVLVESRLQNQIGGKELEDGEVGSLERESPSVVANSGGDGLELEDIADTMQSIALARRLRMDCEEENMTSYLHDHF